LWALSIGTEELKWKIVETAGVPPSPRHGHTANILLRYLVIFAGSADKEYLNDVVMLDLNNMEWTTPNIIGDVPRPMMYHAAITTSNELLVVGGKSECTGKDVSKIYILKPKSERRKSFSMSPGFSEFVVSGFD